MKSKLQNLQEVLVQAIIQYLASNRRLVVPQLGAFIVKAPGESVVFSELLRHDDGVLRNLLCAAGMSEVAAAGAIDRFVFEVRHALQTDGEFVMPGFGVLCEGSSGAIAFTYNPAAFTGKPESRPTPPPAPIPPAEPKLSPSPKMHPEPYVKGLRYGKPEKTTNAYRYVDRVPRRRGFDKLLLVAIAAAVIALATIAYIYIRDSRTEELDYTEQSGAVPDADGQTTIPQP